MAKTISPLLSSSAHGKLGRSLVYSKKKSGLLARAMHYPKKEPSLKQWTQRHLVGLATARWQCMTDNERATYKTAAAASDLNIPGYQFFLRSTFADQETHSGLLLYLSLNESSGENIYCSASNTLAGTLRPTYPDDCPTRVPSLRKEYGNALNFVGPTWHVLIDAAPRLSFGNQITLEVWLKLKDLSLPTSTVLRNWVYEPDDRVFILYLFETQPQFYFSSDGIESLYVLWPTPLTTEWSHLVITLSPDNKIRCFINAIQLPDTGDLTSFHPASNDIYFGSSLGFGNFNGCLDQLLIYNRALSLAEIKKHYQLLRLDKKRQPLLRL